MSRSLFPDVSAAFAALLLLSVSCANVASAATFGFACITNNLATDCAIAEAAFTVEISDGGPGFVDFTFTKSGTDAANLSEVYFDDGSLLGLSSISSSLGVEFTGGSASPPDLPGGNSISPPFNVTAGFLAQADNPAPMKGVNDNTDWLTITFELISGATVADTIAAMGSSLRVGIHVIDFAGGGSESLIAPVPVPAAVWLFGSALGALGWIRRRKMP